MMMNLEAQLKSLVINLTKKISSKLKEKKKKNKKNRLSLKTFQNRQTRSQIFHKLRKEKVKTKY